MVAAYQTKNIELFQSLRVEQSISAGNTAEKIKTLSSHVETKFDK